MPDTDTVSVRYLVDDVAECVDFYTRHFGFTVGISFPPFAEVTRGNLRLLLSGPKSSAGRPMPDGRTPGPGGWNRIHFIVDDIDADVSRLRDAGATFRNDIVTGPGRSPSVIALPAELCGPDSRSRKFPRVTSANAGLEMPTVKPKWRV